MKRATAILASALPLLNACDRPKPLGAQPAAPPPVAAPASVPDAQPDAGTQPAPPPSSKLTAPAPSKPVPALLADYRAQTSPDQRREIIWEIHGTPAAQAIPAIATLLGIEKRDELRIELFDSLDIFDGFELEKIAILRRELIDRRSSGEAYDAAIDALLNIQHRDAIPLWQDLAKDAGDELRDVANQAIEALETL